MYNTPSFTLDNFEGPLELLLYLIQKEEIDACGVAIKELTTQLIQSLKISPEVDTNSELLTLTASLLLIKSQKLLPQEVDPLQEIEDDPRIEMIQSLIEYCRFKEMAKALTEKEEEQKAFFPRAFSPFRKELGTGLEEVDMEGLKNILQNVLRRAEQNPRKIIQGEEWHVSDKIAWLKQLLLDDPHIPFETVFSEEKGRQELIVSFLALLEMMKHQWLKLSLTHNKLYITRYESVA